VILCRCVGYMPGLEDYWPDPDEVADEPRPETERDIPPVQYVLPIRVKKAGRERKRRKRTRRGSA